MQATQFVTCAEEKVFDDRDQILRNADALSLEGARLEAEQTKHKKAYDEAHEKFQNWKDRALEFAKTHNMTCLKIDAREDQKEELGEAGAFLVKEENPYEPLNEHHMLYLFSTFFHDVAPGVSMDKIKLLSGTMYKSILSNRRRGSKMVLVRKSADSGKPPNTRKQGKRKVPDNFIQGPPPTAEELREYNFIQNLFSD